MTLSQDKVNSTFDVVIIGGGASGMACALHLFGMLKTSGKKCLRVALLEKNQRLGKKLLLTGNGRCNITNQSISHENYHGKHERFCLPALSAFDNQATIRFFEGLGLLTFFDETGKAYPESLHASSVLDCMRFALEETGYSIMFSTEIKNIEKTHDGFCLFASNGNILQATCVVVACGGSASPFTGSDGSGFNLLRMLGCRIEDPIPGIVQIKTETDFVKPVSGIKIIGTATLKADEKTVRVETGEILFTDYGLSGPPILQLSGWASRLFARHGSDRSKPDVKISLDLIPQRGEDDVLRLLKERREAYPDRLIEQFLVGIFHNRLASRLLKSIFDIPLSRSVSTLSDEDLIRIASGIKHTNIRVTGVMPLSNAQVTIGGADTDQFDPHTMSSLIHRGLYACGEVLDIDGDCGGYNLQWAWASAYLTARSIADRIGKENL